MFARRCTTAAESSIAANSPLAVALAKDAALSALDTGRPVVFASAGVGITPMAGMLSHLAAARSGLEIMLVHADEHEGTVARRRQVVSITGCTPG